MQIILPILNDYSDDLFNMHRNGFNPTELSRDAFETLIDETCGSFESQLIVPSVLPPPVPETCDNTV